MPSHEHVCLKKIIKIISSTLQYSRVFRLLNISTSSPEFFLKDSLFDGTVHSSALIPSCSEKAQCFRGMTYKSVSYVLYKFLIFFTFKILILSFIYFLSLSYFYTENQSHKFTQGRNGLHNTQSSRIFHNKNKHFTENAASHTARYLCYQHEKPVQSLLHLNP